MKKILSLVIALALVLTAVSALAAGSKTSGDIPSSNTSSDDGAAVIILEIIPDTEESAAVIQKIKDAYDAGDALSVLPDDVKAKIPEGFATVNEIVTAHFVGDVEKASGVYDIVISFTSPFEGESVYLVFGSLAGDKYEVVEAKPQADGSVALSLTADQIKAFGTNPFTIMAVSK